MDYDVQRFTRHCAKSGRELAPGEAFYTALVVEGPHFRRLDYAVESWQGPPEGALGWWKSRVPAADERRPKLAPNEVLLEFFRNLEDVPGKQDLRLVMALLLVRRRVLRLEEQERDELGREVLTLHSPREDVTYRVTGILPDSEREKEIQAELSQLLFAGGS